MPRYKFKCSECDNIETVFLRMSETYEDCSMCNTTNTMQKQFDKFFCKSVSIKEQKVGSVTKQYIEKNKQILEDQKKEAQKEEYEPS